MFGYAFWDDMLPGDDIPPLDGIARSTGAARQKAGAHSDGSANCRETYSRASSTAIRVLLADHRQLVRCALRYLLDEAYDTHVVAEASDGAEVLSKFAAARPDVCVLDACMPRTDNCGMLASILSIDAEARILLVTMNSDPLSAALALHAGASGCISKHADVSDLYDAIRCVARKRRYLPLESRAGAVQPLLGFGSLSNREEQILSRVAAGRTQRDIALELEIDTRTVGTYLSRAANKLGLDSNLEVCLRAARSNRLLASLRWRQPSRADRRVTAQADTVVIAAGSKPETSVYDALQGTLPEVHRIGDCVKARTACEAIEEAALIARKI